MHVADSTTIDHVRLRGAQMDAPAASGRLSYLLSSVGLRPSRMSPSAVLVVRSMPDPLPGAIARHFATAAFPSPAWESAAAVRVDALWAEAARPARSVVRSSAEAVLFADYSELLACLARDLATGAGLPWWWQSILRHHLVRGLTAQADAWPRVWAEHPTHVPAAFHYLDEWKQAARVIERITPRQAWSLLHVLARAFGLPPSIMIATPDEAAFAPATDNEPPNPTAVPADDPIEIGTPRVQTQRGTRPGPAHSPRRRAPTDPWEPYVPSGTTRHALGAERRALLGIALLLHRAPAQAASPYFAARVRSWLSGGRALARGNDETDTTSPPRNARSDQHVRPVTQAGVDANSARPALEESSSPCDQRTAHHRPRSGASSLAGIATEAQSRNEDENAAPAVPDNDHIAPLAPDTPYFPETKIQFEDGSPTRLGGIFYLIHPLLRSDLLSFEVGLRGWALLELLARCLLDPEWPAIADDPIWDALALLDFREPDTHPGTDFTPQPVYQAPESWLHGPNEGKRYARFRSQRLEIWHEEGFLTLDTSTPIRTPFCARITPHQRRAFRQDARVRAAGLDLTPELRRFLHFLLPYLRWRLRRALGDMSLTHILHCSGTLYITHSHVDLVMPMNQISVPARIAGLDANPGWTPELGRIIKFHFVDDYAGAGP